MKRLTILFALMVLTLALLLSACGGKGDSDTDKESEKSNEQSTETSTETNTETDEHVHTEEIIVGVKPTCTKEGLSDGKKCSECEEILVEQVPVGKTMHTYVDSYTCTVCGETTLESQGLEYTYIEENNAYYVSGIGTCTDNDIVIPYEYNGLPVIGIGSGAFYECVNITSVTLSNNVTFVESSAFQKCYGMVRFIGGTGLEESTMTPFIGCTKLMEMYDLSKEPLTLERAQTSLRGWGGVFNNNGGPFDLMAVHTSINEPSVIAAQDDFMFITKDNKNYLLGYTGDATDVELPQAYNDEAYYIFKYAFSNRIDVKNISVPNNVLGVLKCAFCEPSLVGLDESLYTSFEFNEYEGGKYIGNKENQYLILIHGKDALQINEKTRIIADEALFGYSDNKDIYIPNNVIYIGNKSIYADCKNIIIGKALSEVSENAFTTNPSKIEVDKDNNNFKSVDGNLYSKDGKILYKQVGSKKEFEIPNGVTTVKPYAFMDGTIESLTIPKSVTKFEKDSFNYNPDDVNYLGALKDWLNIEFEDTSIVGGNLYFNGNLVEDLVIPGDVREIKAYAFEGCRSIKTVTVENGLTKIGDRAFYGCSNLRKIKLPESLVELGDYSFAGCAIKTVVIPQNVILQDCNAFYYCESLIEIYNLTAYDSEEIDLILIGAGFNGNKVTVHGSLDEPSLIQTVGDYVFASLENGIYLIEYTGTSSIVELPKDFNGEEYIVDLTTIESIVPITEITIPEGFALTEKTKTEMSLPTSVVSVKIKAKWEEIPRSFFAYCENLETVELPEGLKIIGAGAFTECHSLRSIVIPSTVAEINRTAFSRCYSLVEVYNLSSIEFECNTDSDFCKYVVHTSLDEESIFKTVGDFVFVEGLENRYGYEVVLVDYIGNDKIIMLPENYNGESYIVGEYALTDSSIKGVIFTKSIDVLETSFNLKDMYCYEELPYCVDGSSFQEQIYEAFTYWHSETEPTTGGKYWHYVDGVVTIWQ